MTTDQKVWGSNPYGRAEVSLSNSGYVARYSSASLSMSSHSHSQIPNSPTVKWFNPWLCLLASIRSAEPEWASQLHSSNQVPEGLVCCRGLSLVVASKRQRSSENSWCRKRSQQEFSMSENKLLTISQACEYLAISRATLYRLIDSQQIVSLNIGRSRRISQQALDRFVAVRTQAVYDAWE